MQYYFAHYLNLEPKVMGIPLYRGNLGHEAFQVYSEARIEGKSHDDSVRASQSVFMKALKQPNVDVATVLETKGIYEKYQGFHKGWPGKFRILSVEQRFDLPLNEDINITIRYDTMVEEIPTGKTLIGDYKFTYDFWTPDDHSLNGQMPKYISVMRANGYDVHGGFLEELRTRKLSAKNGNADDPKQLWRRTHYFPSNAKKRNTIRQHIAAGFEIIDYWNGSDEDREIKSLPVLNKHGACKFCNFKDLCASKLDGGDITEEIKRSFQTNTYGYNNATPNEMELL